MASILKTDNFSFVNTKKQLSLIYFAFGFLALETKMQSTNAKPWGRFQKRFTSAQ